MSTSNLIRWSGLASILGGICMNLFVLVHPFGELDPPKVINGPLSKEPVFALSYVFMIVLLLASYLLFGVSIIRAQVLPRWATVLLIFGALLFFEPPVLVPYVIPFVGALVFGVALVRLGSVLWFQKAKMARQPQVIVERTTIS